MDHLAGRLVERSCNEWNTPGCCFLDGGSPVPKPKLRMISLLNL